MSTQLTVATGSTMLPLAESTEPICLQDSGQNLSFCPSLLSPIKSVPVTPTGSLDLWTGADILTGFSPLKPEKVLDVYQLPSSEVTPSLHAVSISGPPAKIARIAQKSLINDSTKQDVTPVVPRLKLKRSVPNVICSTASVISNVPLSPRSRLKAWSRRTQASAKNGLGLESQETDLPPQHGKLTSNNAKPRFGQLLLSLQVVNGQEYEEQLKINPEVRNHVEGMKKIVFRLNFLLRSERWSGKLCQNQEDFDRTFSFLERWVVEIDSPGLTQKFNGVFGVDAGTQTMVTNVNGEKKGLILIGQSDSGKTFLADCKKVSELCPNVIIIESILFNFQLKIIY